MNKYMVKHKVDMTYHLQSSGQTRFPNMEMKRILEKIINPSRIDWLKHLDDALWT